MAMQHNPEYLSIQPETWLSEGSIHDLQKLFRQFQSKATGGGWLMMGILLSGKPFKDTDGLKVALIEPLARIAFHAHDE
jgi:hypothetical protein